MRKPEISIPNLEKVPEEKVLTQEHLNRLAENSSEKGGNLLNDMGQFIRLQELEDGIWYISPDLVDQNHDQIRQNFDEKKLDELETSIIDRGQETPAKTVPYRNKEGNIRMILEAGARRHLVLTRIGAQYIKIEVKWRKTYRELYEATGRDNLERANNNPVEEATYYKRLIEYEMEADGITQTEAVIRVAEKFGRNPAYIKNMIKLTEVSPIIQKAIIEGMPKNIGLEIANLARRVGTNASSAELMAVRQILEDPEKEYETEQERLRDLGQLNTTRVREIMREVLAATGGMAGRETSDRAEAAERIMELVSVMQTMIRRSKRLTEDPDLIPVIIEILQERRGYPPDEIFQKLETILSLIKGINARILQTATETTIPIIKEELTTTLEKIRDEINQILEISSSTEQRGYPTEKIKERASTLFQELRSLHQQVVVPALQPPKLKIPEGAPSFRDKLEAEGTSLKLKSALKFKIATILAEASDDNSRLISIDEIRLKLHSLNLKVKTETISEFVATLDEDLTKTDLKVDTQIIRKRNPQGTLEKIATYRLKWAKTS